VTRKFVPLLRRVLEPYSISTSKEEDYHEAIDHGTCWMYIRVWSVGKRITERACPHSSKGAK
jgi:hypothetical protein